MYKILLALILFGMTQCKSNKVFQGDINTPEVIIVSSDTVKTVKHIVYRGDSLIKEIITVGDKVVSRRTYNRGYGKDRFVKSRSKTLGRGEVMMMETAAMDASPPRTREAPVAGKVKPEGPINPQAGQITAGEWNDLNNWEDWKDLLNDNDYYEMQSYWGLYPTKRYSVFITNDQKTPLIDIKVDLEQDGKVVWSSRTDHSGKAELWASLTDNSSLAKSKLSAKAYFNNQSYSINVNEGESTHFTIANECNMTNAVDIMFVVDATGSMGDEINYLKSELKDVVKRATQSTDGLDLRIGSVFYRDGKDAYLTKVSPLDKNLEKAYDFIDAQSAQGGGDYPEAVDAALEEALAQEWSDNAITRIIFLLLDAPPHDDDGVKRTLRDQISEAAERGIKIIPISASGINRETEFLLKFMSISTNGTYVFITDDSGIGNPHLAPLVDDFEVETLNDLMVRLISSYTTVQKCGAKLVQSAEIKIYPNPTSNYVTVEPSDGTLEVRLVSSTGMTLFRSKKVEGSLKIDMMQYVDGIYTIQCIGGDFTYSYPVIKVTE